MADTNEDTEPFPVLDEGPPWLVNREDTEPPEPK